MTCIHTFKLQFGICVILQYKVFFNYLLEKKITDEIHYVFDENLIKHFRGDYPVSYTDGMKIVAKFLFNDPRIKEIDGQDIQLYPVANVQQDFNIPNNLPLDYKSLITEDPIIQGDYITVNTKIIDVDLEVLRKLLPDFLDILKQSKYIVVIIGERNMTSCMEYTHHKDYYGCIYQDLINANLNCIDMTYPETYDGYSIERLKKSMNLSKYAKHNIILNSGGSLALGLGFENVIALCGAISAQYHMFDHSASQIFHCPFAVNEFLTALKEVLLNPE